MSVTSRHLALSAGSSNQEGSLPCRHRSSVAEAALLASLTAAALVAGTATTAALGSSAQAAPAADCAAPYPVASLVDRVTSSPARPSRQGVTPAPFTGEVIGVLDDGIAPGLDMVIVDLDSPAIYGRRRHLAGHVGVPGLRRRRST